MCSLGNEKCDMAEEIWAWRAARAGCGCAYKSPANARCDHKP